MNWLSGALALAVAASAAAPPIALNDKEYFESGPGFSFLLFHNNYQVGFQGGLQMIQNGERLLDSGDLLLVPRQGNEPERRVSRREVDRARSQATVFGEAGEIAYRLISSTDGERIVVTLQLDRPIDWTRYAQAGFRMFLFSGAYYSKSFQGDSAQGVFPQQYTGKNELLAGTRTLRIAQEDPRRQVRFRRLDGGALTLTDEREDEPASWFRLTAPLRPGSTEKEVRLEVTPSIDPAWRRAPVLAISQVGYHPNQTKRAVLELDPRDPGSGPARLLKLTPEGDRKLAKSAEPRPWGRFQRYEYRIFDFTDVLEPGVYVLEYGGQSAGPFRIDAAVLDDTWKPTLQYFLPVQMCHVAVREGVRTWHGPCHLDDARQAPEGRMHFDGYQQGKRETRFDDNEPIPGLDWGGWHDAGDNDLPAGSIAITTLALALAHEEFHPELDQTSVNRPGREVLLHVADRKPDLLQQVEYGVEGMLASYRAAGYIFPGIIESTSRAYSHLGDTAGSTGARWAFTNRNTGLQYEVAQALAASSRVLRGMNDALAGEALAAAQALYQYEQTHPPVYARNAYVPRDSGFRGQEMSAAAELLLTTGEANYRERLLALLPELKKAQPEPAAEGPGWTLVRLLPVMKDRAFTSTVTEMARAWRALAADRAASNPYGVHLPQEIADPGWKLEARSGIHSGFVWGPGWDLQADAMRHYYFHKHLPALFDQEPLMATVSFVLGCHPGSNQSYVSGVGARSPLIAYGFNRADWSHIPGGVISGAALVKPDFMELKEFPFLWYQTEYVIGGAGTYIFDVLAAHHLLDREGK